MDDHDAAAIPRPVAARGNAAMRASRDSLSSLSSLYGSWRNACALVLPATVLLSLGFVLFPLTARAQGAPPAAHKDDAFDVMNLLAAHDLHDIHDEPWNVYGQFTFIATRKLAFSAPYTNANGSTNSLLPTAENSFTGSFTLFFGVRLWRGGEAYFVPEVISERALSNLRGIGGSIQNFELQKTGTAVPQIYRSRAYVRQTFNLGGGSIEKTSDPMQLGAKVDKNRLVLVAGNFTVLDFFDKNSVAGDPRQTFFNMAFMTYSSWDFNADARGYTWGGIAELYWHDWALRAGRTAPPKNPNSLPIDFRIWNYYGDQIELEHDHEILGQPGAVRLLGYRNHVDTGRFDDAIAALQADPGKNAARCTDYNYGSSNGTAPDLCWVRKANVKVGIGLSIEQHVADDMGIYFRGMYSDGQTEVNAYNPADRSVSLGASAKGETWHRPLDVAGVGVAASWISSAHARYLALGGIDGFVGDGHLRQAAEKVVEFFYSVNLLSSLWLSVDYQHLRNPGFNADRGPVNLLGGRAHAEF